MDGSGTENEVQSTVNRALRFDKARDTTLDVLMRMTKQQLIATVQAVTDLSGGNDTILWAVLEQAADDSPVRPVILPHEVPAEVMREILAAPDSWVALAFRCKPGSIRRIRRKLGVDATIPQSPAKCQSPEWRLEKGHFIEEWTVKLAALAHGRCSAGATRWLPIPDYEGLYEISEHGDVRHAAPSRNSSAGQHLKQSLTRKGYRRVMLHSQRGPTTRQVHRLVAAAFLGPCPDGCEVNHKDGNPSNSRLENLEYITHAENVKDAIRRAGYHSGTKNNCAKLTDNDALAILQSRDPAKVLAAKYGVDATTVYRIRNGQAWQHLAR